MTEEWQKKVWPRSSSLQSVWCVLKQSTESVRKRKISPLIYFFSPLTVHYFPISLLGLRREEQSLTRIEFFGAVKCFPFSNGDKNDEPKTTKSISVRSSASTSTDQEMRRSRSEFNSLNASDISTESSARISFASLSQRPSNLRVFTFSELKTATKNFSHTLMIGEGGFGGVYRGMIRDTEDSKKKIDIAVKQLSRRGLQGHKEWVTEVNVLGVVEHPNLVKLVGYCAEDDERGMQRLLIYEYMPNRSVLDHLSSRFHTPLPWITRLKIAQDAAHVLVYLHEGMDFQVHQLKFFCRLS